MIDIALACMAGLLLGVGLGLIAFHRKERYSVPVGFLLVWMALVAAKLVAQCS